MGEHFASKDDEKLRIDVKPNDWTDHPEYDVSIITLRNSVSFTREIQPACLPDNKGKTYRGEEVVATGWGGLGTSWNAPTADELQKVHLTVVDCPSRL